MAPKRPAPLRSRFGNSKLAVLCLLACIASAGGSGSHAEYVGGTISKIPEGCAGTVAALGEILPALRRDGYELVTVSELLTA